MANTIKPIKLTPEDLKLCAQTGVKPIKILELKIKDAQAKAARAASETSATRR